MSLEPETPSAARKREPEANGVDLTDPDYARLMAVMGYDPISVDQLIAQSGLTAEAVSSMLLLLELEGTIQSAPGGRYSRTGENTC